MSAASVTHQWGAVAGFAAPKRAVRFPSFAALPASSRRRGLAERSRQPPPHSRVSCVGGDNRISPRRSPLAIPSPASRQTAPARAAATTHAGRSKQSKEEKKAAKAAKKKAAPAVSKQAKDAARKKAAAAMREVVSKQGKAYDRVVRELDRDQYREYVLSVRHSPAGDADPEPVLSDWLPVCEVIVADKQQYEARKFFKENNMDIPETEQQSVSAEQIEGVPAIKACLLYTSPSPRDS